MFIQHQGGSFRVFNEGEIKKIHEATVFCWKGRY